VLYSKGIHERKFATMLKKHQQKLFHFISIMTQQPQSDKAANDAQKPFDVFRDGPMRYLVRTHMCEHQTLLS
jgi:hypothetical protein